MATTNEPHPRPQQSPDSATLRMVYRALQALAGRSTTRLSLADIAVAADLEAATVVAAMRRFERVAPATVQPVGGQPSAWEVSL
jgi:hypothetical protein